MVHSPPSSAPAAGRHVDPGPTLCGPGHAPPLRLPAGQASAHHAVSFTHQGRVPLQVPSQLRAKCFFSPSKTSFYVAVALSREWRVWLAPEMCRIAFVSVPHHFRFHRFPKFIEQISPSPKRVRTSGRALSSPIVAGSVRAVTALQPFQWTFCVPFLFCRLHFY